MDWQISGRAKSCERCGKQFEPTGEIVSAVYDDASQLIRRDFCFACWKPGDDVFSFWRHVVPPPQEPRMADRSALMGLFVNLADAVEDRKRDFRYVLALALMRRRALKTVASRREGGRETLELRHPPDESLHQVEVRPMSEERIQALVEEVTKVIHLPGEEQRGGQGESPPEEAAT